MTKRKVNYLPVPRDAFMFDAAILATSIHKLHSQNKHIIVNVDSDDSGNIIARVAKLLKHGFNVYIKTDDNLWMNHFEYVGEARYGFKVYTRRPISSNSDVQQT